MPRTSSFGAHTVSPAGLITHATQASTPSGATALGARAPSTPVGVPAVYTALLFFVHGRGGDTSQMLGFLTRSYRAPYFWWELVETAKKLLFASFFALPFMGHGTLVQLLVAMVLQLAFLVLQVYAAPFRRPSDNYFALSANVALVFVFFSCMVRPAL